MSSNIVNDKDSIVRLEIVSVHLNILTPIEVKCEAFDTYFNSPKRVLIDSKAERDSVLSMLRETRTIGKVFSALPDTRGKILISYENGNTESYCFDDQLINLEGTTYYTSPSFKTYLWSVSETKR